MKLDCTFQDTIKSDSDTIEMVLYEFLESLGIQVWCLGAEKNGVYRLFINPLVVLGKIFSFPWKPQSTKAGQWPQKEPIVPGKSWLPPQGGQKHYMRVHVPIKYGYTLWLYLKSIQRGSRTDWWQLFFLSPKHWCTSALMPVYSF